MFATDRPIVILDEPTAALDEESERYVSEAIEELCGSRTIVIIAHRLRTIQRADRIIVMQDGSIVEEGAFEGLIRGKGALRRIHQGLASV